MHIDKIISILCILMLSCWTAQGQQYPKSEAIALPQGTLFKSLPNGLRYILKANDLPGHKIEFRLVIPSGSLRQTRHEGGVAHFLEHMAFNGTTHFPEKGIVNYLESLGVKYGFGINAFTGFDRTIYMFSIPTDHPEGLDQALLILKDWLCGITIAPEEVEGEKGIILEEERGYDTGDVFYDLKVKNTRYSRRMPLGTPEEIQNMTARKLKKFYHKWYTPASAALIIVGDIDTTLTEKKIQELFAGIPAHKTTARAYSLNYPQKIIYQDIADTLLSRSSLELILPKPTITQHTYGDKLEKAKKTLLVSAINERFKALQLNVSLSKQWYLGDKDHLVLSFEGKNDTAIQTQISQAVNALKNIRQTGFCSAELQHLKENIIRKSAHLSTVKNSDEWCEDFIDLILSGERYLQDTLHQNGLAQHIRNVQSRELQIMARQWFSNPGTILAAYRYHPEKGISLDKKMIKAAWKSGEKSPCQPYEYIVREQEEQQTVPLPGFLTREITPAPACIAAERWIETLGIKELQLANGVRLILKPTKDEAKQITIHTFAPGGTSLLTPDNYALLEGTAGYMEMGGIEKMDYDTYGMMLAQENMAFTVLLETYWHGWMAMAPADKSTELCHLIYEKCFYPEKRYEDFEEIRRDMLAAPEKETVLSKMLRNAPDRQLSKRMDELMGNIIPFGNSPENKQQIEALNLDSIADFYRQLYTNPDGMTCVVCGNFDLREVEKKLVATLGAFPRHHKPNQWVDPQFQLPAASYQEEFPNQHPNQTVFDYLFYGHHKNGLRHSLTLKLVRDVVRNRLLSILREKESLLYSPYISLFYKGYPQPTYYFDINASVDTKYTAKVDKLLREIIRDIQEKPVTPEELSALQRSFIVTRRESINDYATAEWKKYLSGALKDGEDLDELARYEEILYSITPEDIRNACRQYFNLNNYVLLHMGPFEK